MVTFLTNLILIRISSENAKVVEVDSNVDLEIFIDARFAQI